MKQCFGHRHIASYILTDITVVKCDIFSSKFENFYIKFETQSKMTVFRKILQTTVITSL